MIARVLRWMFALPVTHVRAELHDERWGRVDTACGNRVHHTQTCSPRGAVRVALVCAEPLQWTQVRPERWVTCPDCRALAGWFDLTTVRRRSGVRT